MKQVEGRWTELAEAVAAGAPIDWDSLDAILTDDHDRRVLAQFKVLAIVAEVYRRQQFEPATIH